LTTRSVVILSGAKDLLFAFLTRLLRHPERSEGPAFRFLDAQRGRVRRNSFALAALLPLHQRACPCYIAVRPTCFSILIFFTICAEAAMKGCIWRIVLPILMVLLFLGLSPRFFGGIFGHSLGLYFIVHYLNAVPLSVSNPIAQFQISHQMLYWTRGYWPRYIFWQFQLLVVLFWLWVGWKIDLKLASREPAPAVSIVEIVAGIALSLFLLLHRPYAHIYRPDDNFPVAVIFWGVLLLGYSVFRAARLWSVQHAR
jgi:hypothetical protein